ncbi:cytochrome c556 [Rhodovulum imhoffii]|uniref:Cytochrome c556 n=1 Tax=Rhodovulum imhoffii TaxID=365340 RepID=A0A2T5BVR9_9RHOB|nr:cytochrome c [Rhodovulum imhoffii]MBK5932786.1 cytochrome C [Rhodovulum imhoffii]PTN03645.1 cytochrome c556 [Rhodovulum imhoffii]
MRKILMASALIALPLTAFAAPAEDVAEARKGFYKLLGIEMDGLVSMVKGETEYSAEKAQGHAADIKTLTQYNMGDIYAPGTSNADLPGKTRALPAIWEDGAGVQEKGMAFVKAVENLNAVAVDGKDELAKAVQQLGGACKACHDDYRAKDF